MYHNSQLQTAVSLINNYKGPQPFHTYLKKYFSENKKHGSRDRKNIASLCYNFFRPGKQITQMPVEEAILTGTFLCEYSSNKLLEALKPEWNEIISEPVNQKLLILKDKIKIENIFPFQQDLSTEIDAQKFAHSFLIQPKVFIRIRPGYKKTVLRKLQDAQLSFEQISNDCLAFASGSKLDVVIDIGKEAVIQDRNSQRVEELMKDVLQPGTKVWDCCAASGGKSIMAFDIQPEMDLTVSDKRAPILENLKGRFQKAGIKKYKIFVADLESPSPKNAEVKYDLIIADVPCTGSGTWARTPEQLFAFNKKEIDRYSTLQRKIIGNAVKNLKPGGKFLYITCSVFKEENEDAVKFLEENYSLKTEGIKILKGYEKQADTMFAALLTSPEA